MPYIKQARRDEMMDGGEFPANTAGELNFELTRVCNAYMQRGHKSYQEINDIVGALECCKQEFYWRIARPYEDEKCETNGDVY